MSIAILKRKRKRKTSLERHLKNRYLSRLMEPEPEQEIEPQSPDIHTYEWWLRHKTMDKDRDLQRQFPNCPFEIDCLPITAWNRELDKVFVKRKCVAIFDDRADGWYYDDVPDKHKYYHYTVVEAERGKYITLRDILKAMIADPHYHDNIVRGDCHRFLEAIEPRDELYKNKYDCFTCFWGS
jgi:hypothetical protein